MSTKNNETSDVVLSSDQLAKIAESFEQLNARIDRYDKTLSFILTTTTIMAVVFLAGAGLASFLH